MERILPSATIELVVNLHKNQIRIYDPLTLEARARFSGAVVSGTYTAPFACDGEEHTAMFGVHFKPGGALPFLTVPASELADSHVDLRDLWGSTAQEFRERLCQVTNPQTRFAVAECFLRERLSLGVIPHSAIVAGLRLFRKGISIREVATEVGFSHRHFIKLFVDQVGLPPKRVCRLLRFQRALNTVRRSDISWKDLAQKCGYFDQAHLVRDFREFAYACPSELGDEPDPDQSGRSDSSRNRIILQVSDLPSRIAELKSAGLHFRNEMEVGPGGKQVQIEDPDGNPIELFEPAS